ncbi:MAG: hypothetical protein IJU96_10695 [Clostridia bacterium]|nr:hypothetical protein [Clostridia bacterium]
MNIQELEPFACGYAAAESHDLEYKIACGFRSFAEHIPLTIDPSAWFVGPVGSMDRLAFRYERASGIRADENRYRAEREAHPELRAALDRLMDRFFALETPRIISKIRSPEQETMERCKAAWAAGGGHSNPDYELLLRVGTNGVRERIELFSRIHTDRQTFYDSLLLCVEALETIADRYKALALAMLKTAEGEDKAILGRLASALDNVPRHQPRDFFEACEMFWLIFTFADIDSPGLFDYALGRYYEISDEADRYACLSKLWELFHQTRTWNLCIGGSDEFGNDRSCALSYDVLKIAREKKYNTPNITMRVHPNTPDALWQAAVETLATGIGMPAIYNDECVCPALEALGIPPSDSHLYCMNGCNQIDIFGKSHMGLEDGEISVAKALEFALFNGVCQYSGERLGLETGDPTGFDTFEKLYDAFLRQVDYLLDYVTETSNKAQALFAAYAPNPWKSIMIQGCIEKGLDYKNRGPIYGHGQILTEGLPDAVDSLYALKTLVYDTGKVTIGDFIAALNRDFEGDEALLAEIKAVEKYGNDCDGPDRLNAAVTDHIYRYAQTKETFRGGRFGVGCSTFERAANYGRHLGALPNGKKKFAPLLADSIGPTPGNDKTGPTAALNSVLKANQYLATSGNVLQLKFSKSQFATPAGMNAYLTLAKTYFRLGGQTLQINVVSKEELLDAKRHPERHENLIVRVGGFSEYFNRLEPDLQDNIIARTEVELS